VQPGSRRKKKSCLISVHSIFFFFIFLRFTLHILISIEQIFCSVSVVVNMPECHKFTHSWQALWPEIYGKCKIKREKKKITARNVCCLLKDKLLKKIKINKKLNWKSRCAISLTFPQVYFIVRDLSDKQGALQCKIDLFDFSWNSSSANSRKKIDWLTHWQLVDIMCLPPSTKMFFLDANSFCFYFFF
jgi:hypothetical protein